MRWLSGLDSGALSTSTPHSHSCASDVHNYRIRGVKVHRNRRHSSMPPVWGSFSLHFYRYIFGGPETPPVRHGITTVALYLAKGWAGRAGRAPRKKSPSPRWVALSPPKVADDVPLVKPCIYVTAAHVHDEPIDLVIILCYMRSSLVPCKYGA